MAGGENLRRSGRAAAWVALGGVAGTAARLRADDALPRPDGLPLATLVVNLLGALVLGALLESLARRGPDAGARQRVRLLLGTGFCGAFTTYSSFAVDADLLVRDGRAGWALAYVAATVVLGLVACGAGVWCGGVLHRRRAAPPRRTTQTP